MVNIQSKTKLTENNFTITVKVEATNILSKISNEILRTIGSGLQWTNETTIAFEQLKVRSQKLKRNHEQSMVHQQEYTETYSVRRRWFIP